MKRVMKRALQYSALATLSLATLYSAGCTTCYQPTASFHGYDGRTNEEMIKEGELEKKTTIDWDKIGEVTIKTILGVASVAAGFL